MVGAGEGSLAGASAPPLSGTTEGTLRLSKPSASRRVTTSPRQAFGERDAILLIAGVADSARPSGLCESARLILADTGTDLLVCDVNALTRPDVGTVDALARLTLVAKHLGGEVLLLDAPHELRELLDLAGLADVVPCVDPSGGEPER